MFCYDYLTGDINYNRINYAFALFLPIFIKNSEIHV